jgi:hypothetical protein
MFHSVYSPKTHNSASSLNTLYTAESAQFYSAFSPTTISLTPRFRRKREILLKMHSYEDAAKFNVAFSATKRSAMLRAFGENGEFSKISNICANFKNVFENVGCTAFCIY